MRAGLPRRRHGAASTIIMAVCMTPSTAKQACMITRMLGQTTKSIGAADTTSLVAQSRPPRASCMTAKPRLATLTVRGLSRRKNGAVSITGWVAPQRRACLMTVKLAFLTGKLVGLSLRSYGVAFTSSADVRSGSRLVSRLIVMPAC